MIVIGYQGIGKSTLKEANFKYLDLQSEDFYVNEKRDENWYKVYCKIAEGFSAQGYTVFVSSHKEVRDELKNSAEKVVLCYPSPAIKDEWIVRLRDRYKATTLEHDFRAYRNAEKHFDEDIADLMKSEHNSIVIDKPEYDLIKMIEEC